MDSDSLQTSIADVQDLDYLPNLFLESGDQTSVKVDKTSEIVLVSIHRVLSGGTESLGVPFRLDWESFIREYFCLLDRRFLDKEIVKPRLGDLAGTTGIDPQKVSRWIRAREFFELLETYFWDNGVFDVIDHGIEKDSDTAECGIVKANLVALETLGEYYGRRIPYDPFATTYQVRYEKRRQEYIEQIRGILELLQSGLLIPSELGEHVDTVRACVRDVSSQYFTSDEDPAAFRSDLDAAGDDFVDFFQTLIKLPHPNIMAKGNITTCGVAFYSIEEVLRNQPRMVNAKSRDRGLSLLE